ncbi:hypothetical protein JQN09_23495 [Phocaeicola dorei]|jgi:hypothetical protein|nr:hypothetical protein [Phocaeicola dorei]MBT1308173.1 hypothetical protein [Phocaeicola dorei]MBT1314842.1 hypothetical protein [Phocaeicola dorei]
MKTAEVNKKIIGRHCKCIFTGLLVTGAIEAIKENEHSVQVKVRFDTPHQWGDELFPMTDLSDVRRTFSAL